MLVQRCFDFADSAPKSQEKTLAWLSLRWAQWPCLEVLGRLRACCLALVNYYGKHPMVLCPLC